MIVVNHKILEGGTTTVKRSKKWITCTLIFSQLLTTFPVSAAVVTTDTSLEVAQNEESAQPEEKEGENEEAPSDMEPEIPEEVVPDPEPIPDEQPTPEPTPEPEIHPTPNPSTRPETKPEEKDTPESVPAPEPTAPKQPRETENQDQSSPDVPETKEVPHVPELTEKASDGKGYSMFEVTPVKETWAFIKEIGEEARQVGLEEDLYASVMIAQAILESASGQSQLSQAPYHNLFGIKGRYEGKGVTFKTQEDDGSGKLYTIEATFRQYDDFEETFKDYAKLLKEGLVHNRDFYKGTWKSETDSYEEATDFLTGRYATDTQYGEKLNALIKAYALTSYDKEKEVLPEGSQEMIFPVKDPVISSVFGPRGDGFHRGIDFAAPLGTPIMASLSGTIIRSEFHPSWGNYVAIEHENGLTTLYAHNHQNFVTVGQVVEQGEVIASMGSTGNSTGPHLHFEVSLSPRLAQHELIDPLDVLPN